MKHSNDIVGQSILLDMMKCLLDLAAIDPGLSFLFRMAAKDY